MAAKYELTPERLVVRRGLILKSIDEIELYRIRICGWISACSTNGGNRTISSLQRETRATASGHAPHRNAQAPARLSRLVDSARHALRVAKSHVAQSSERASVGLQAGVGPAPETRKVRPPLLSTPTIPPQQPSCHFRPASAGTAGRPRGGDFQHA